MKNLILILITALFLTACSKQINVKPAQEEVTAKGGKGKGKPIIGEAQSIIANDTLRNDAQALLVVNAFNISNPSVGVIAFDNPIVNPGDEWRWTGIDYGTKPDDTTFVKNGGFLIYQSSWIAATGSPINPFVNGNGQVVYTVPNGTQAIRVYHIVFGANGQVREYHSFIVDGFQF